MRADELFWITTLALVGAMVPTVVALVFDRRTLDGDFVWTKPLKFELSLAIHFGTLAWLVGYLPVQVAAGGVLEATAVAAATASLFEVLYIAIQAARGRRSHFNTDTPLEAMLYGLMALGAVVITLAAGIVGMSLLASETSTIGQGLKIGGGVGLLLGTVLTFVTAFKMGGAMSRHNGVEKRGGRRMPITGWSMTVADRRIPHFFATHLMQALPVIGWASDILFPSSGPISVVLIFGGVYSLCTLLLFRAINRGDVVNMKKLSAR